MRLVSVIVFSAFCLVSVSSSGQIAPTGPTGRQLEILNLCASPVTSIRSSEGKFVWKHLLLSVTSDHSLALSANHSGKLVAFDGHGLRIFKPGAYAAPEEISLHLGLVALTVSDGGVVAWLESDNTKDNAPLELHTLRGATQSVSPAFERQLWKVPQSWPELYFVGERLYISEQSGKLTRVDLDGKGHQKFTVEVPPSQRADLTAPLVGGGYFQYRWSTATERGPVKSSVILFSDLKALNAGQGLKTSITSPVRDWRPTGNGMIFLDPHTVFKKVVPWLHLINKSTGQDMAHLDYSSEYCDVTSLDVIDGGSKAVIMLHDGLIQIVDTSDLHILDQIALPQSPDYLGAETIVTVAPNKFLVSTVEGVVLIDAGSRN